MPAVSCNITGDMRCKPTSGACGYVRYGVPGYDAAVKTDLLQVRLLVRSLAAQGAANGPDAAMALARLNADVHTAHAAMSS